MPNDSQLFYSFLSLNVRTRVRINSIFEKDHIANVSDFKQFPIDALFLNFKSICMKLAWLAHTKPDVLFEVSQLAQVVELIFDAISRKDLQRRNFALKFFLWKYCVYYTFKA